MSDVFPTSSTCTYSPVVALVTRDGNRRAVTLHEVVGIVDLLESTRTDHRVDMGTDLRQFNLSSQYMRIIGRRTVHTAPGLMIGSSRVVTIGREPPKIQCSALTRATREARAASLENARRAIVGRDERGGSLWTGDGWSPRGVYIEVEPRVNDYDAPSSLRAARYCTTQLGSSRA